MEDAFVVCGAADSAAMRRIADCEMAGQTDAEGFALDVPHDQVGFAALGEDVVASI